MASSYKMIHDDQNPGSSKRTTERQERMRSKTKSQTSKHYTKTWNDFEKNLLLNLLYEHGDSDLEKLAEGLPNKHPEQIKTYLRTISRRAQHAEEKRQKKQVVKNLSAWIELLENVYADVPVDESLPYQLFSLSKKNSKPQTELSNDVVDFQKAYEYLYALTVGRKIDVDERTYYFVHSYVDWFLGEFEKNVVPEGEPLTTSGLKRVSESAEHLETIHERANLILKLIINKPMPQESLLSYRNMLRHVCRRTRRTMFKKGDEYDRKISLLKAEIDYEPPTGDDLLNLPPTELAPDVKDSIFKNLPSFVWASLFNYSVSDVIHLQNQS